MILNRIIDANINRTSEALRVIEDIYRFLYNNKERTKQIKKFRHEINTLFPKKSNLQARNIKKDKGKFFNTRKEFKRKSLEDIIIANCKRVQESTRVLEESLKLIKIKKAKLFKTIRFKTYEMEKELVTLLQKKIDLSLYCIIDTSLIPIKRIKQTAVDLIKGGATIIQLRSKETDSNTFLKTADKIRKITSQYNTPFIINDRIDIAIACQADGVHIGQRDLSPDIIKEKFSYNGIIGCSASNEKEIKKIIKKRPDYIGLGPIFPTQTKKDIKESLGLKKGTLLYKKYQTQIPIVIIGGIHLENIKMCIKQGIKHFAFISEILSAKNIRKRVSMLKNIIIKI